jgi:Yip1 domain
MMEINQFVQDVARAIYAPGALYRDIHQGRRTPGWLLVLLYCGLYAAYSLLAYLDGRTPAVDPWLRIDPHAYYLAQAVYIIPLIMGLWFQAAGTIHVLGRLSGGQGSFDRTLSMTGYSLWLPWLIFLVFDLLLAPGLALDVIFAACVFLMLAGTSLGVEIEEQIEWGYAFIFSLSAIVAMAVFMFLLVR